jgi:peptidyl-prolyl cis-trans isomerase SurA
VKKLQLAATDDEIEVTVNRISKQNKVNRQQLREALAAQGISFETFRDNVKKQIEKQNLIQKEIRQKVQISEQDLYNYYLTNSKASARAVQEFRLSHILLAMKKYGGKDGAIAKAKEIIKKIRGGMNFPDAVTQYSDDESSKAAGGDLGTFRQGSLDPKLEKVLRDLKTDEVSQPVVSGNTVHILKLTERKLLNDETFEKNKDSIREALQQQEFNRQLELWFAHQKELAHVKVML